MNIQGFEIPIDNDKLSQLWFDKTLGIIHIEYLSRNSAAKERVKFIRRGFQRVTSPVKVKGEEDVFEITIPHPDWTVLNPMSVADNCTPKNATGPRDTLAKHVQGNIIKQEKTEEELLKLEGRYKKSKNLTPREIDDLIFLHKALPQGYYGPDKQIGIKIQDLQEERPKTETPWLRLPSGLTGSELLEIWYNQNPEYK